MTERNYTQEQAVIVERILKHPSHEYYKILEIEKTATDGEIKKAYRKISLKVHPDKNSHPKADESFKKVAKAFEVLGDASKRRIYDQTGADPSSRGNPAGPGGFGGAGFNAGDHPFFQAGGPFGGFAGQQGFNFNGFQGGESPDLFDILFGGQAGGMGGTTFTFGGPGGMRFTTAGGNPFAQQQRRRQQQQQQQQHRQQGPQTVFDGLKQYFPIILVLIIPLLSNLFAEAQEKFSLTSQGSYTSPQVSPNYKIPFYVTPKQADTLAADKLKKLGRDAEKAYIGHLQDLCHRETNIREHHIQSAYGWIFTDNEKLAKAKEIKLPNCEKLAQIGIGLL